MAEIIIVTGKINSGKSTYLQKLAAEEKALGNVITGIIARGIYEGGKKVGYDIIDIADGGSLPLARTIPFADSEIQSGKYYFSQAAFAFAENVLLRFKPNGVVFLDEAGPLELAGKGYADCLKVLLQAKISKLYIVVRKELLADFTEMFIGDQPTKTIKV